MKRLIAPDRRNLIAGAAGLVASTSLMAATLTPRQTAGPLYPEALPADSDMDLTLFGGGKAQGDVIKVSGYVFSAKGHSLPGTVVELWQANAYGRYHHSVDDNPQTRDPHFQGFGAVAADGNGAYRFRTILPGLYSGRTRHIHFRLVREGKTTLVTQMYFPGETGNTRDELFRWLDTEEAQRSATARLTDANSRDRLLFDFVLA